MAIDDTKRRHLRTVSMLPDVIDMLRHTPNVVIELGSPFFPYRAGLWTPDEKARLKVGVYKKPSKLNFVGGMPGGEFKGNVHDVPEPCPEMSSPPID